LTVPVNDAAALADAMAKLSGDAAMRQRFAANARALVVAKFSAEAIGRQTIDLYDQLIAS
jgi:glycosyltransferase involved in cell wall biosynthesis